MIFAIYTKLVTPSPFDIPDDFSPSALFETSFGLFNSEDSIRVRLRFKWNTWTAITNRTWGSDQKMTKNSDGSFTLEFTSIPGYELESWIRSFGSDVMVLDPPELREKIIGDFREALAQY
jgi:predicted DNA-binding transcriptional regulator YafY